MLGNTLWTLVTPLKSSSSEQLVIFNNSRFLDSACFFFCFFFFIEFLYKVKWFLAQQTLIFVFSILPNIEFSIREFFPHCLPLKWKYFQDICNVNKSFLFIVTAHLSLDLWRGVYFLNQDSGDISPFPPFFLFDMNIIWIYHFRGQTNIYI